MGYKFTCTSCEHSWDIVYMGSYTPALITSFPCPKCDNKSITAEKVEGEIIENKEISAAIIKGEHNMRPSGDFINHLQDIKKAHVGNTMQDKWT